MSNSTSVGTPAVPPGVNVTAIIAPFLYGYVGSWALLGIIIHQVYVYNSRFASRDALYIKIIVYTVLVLELVYIGFMTHLTHNMLITGWGNPRAVLRVPWSIVVHAPITSTIALLVQSFFLWRLWKINPKSIAIRVAIIFVAAISLMHFGSAIALSYIWVVRNNLSIVSARKNTGSASVVVLTEIALIGAFVCDIFITGLMIITLLRLRKESTSVRSTWHKINTLIIRAVQTGAVTILFAMIELVLFSHPKMKGNAYFVAFALTLSKFYSTMLMANLNGRGQFSGAGDMITVSNARPGVDVELTTSWRIRKPTNNILISTEVQSSYATTSKAHKA